MNTTRELIAAALTECDVMTGMLGYEPATLRDIRELCARAMVQPDIAEVERLVNEFESAAGPYGHDLIGVCGSRSTTHTALLDYVRGILAERDQFRDAAKMVSAAPQPVGEPYRVDQPAGWRCTRANGHKGPCAAVEDRA